MRKDKWQIHSGDLPPEIRLMLLCMKKDMSDSQREKALFEITCGIDWKLFVRHANKHRVFPVVYKNLRACCDGHIDDSVMTFLKKKSAQNISHSLKISSELVRITGKLNQQEIRVISLKGPLLSLSLYGDINIRVANDLDLMVDPCDLEATDQLLIDAGYHRVLPKDILTGKAREIFLKNNHHFAYSNDLNVHVELHWKFDFLRFDVKFNELWEDRRTLLVNGTWFNVLNKEEEFLFCVFHGAKHGWNRLRWLSDVAEIISRGDVEWDTVIKRAGQVKISHALAQAMILCRELMNVPIPDILAPVVDGNSRGSKLASMAIPIMLDTDESHEGRNLKKFTSCFLNGFSLKLKNARMHFDPLQEDIETVKMSDKAFFLYYLIRPLNSVRRKLNRKSARNPKEGV